MSALEKPSLWIYSTLEITGFIMRPEKKTNKFLWFKSMIQLLGQLSFMLNNFLYIMDKNIPFPKKLESLHFIIAISHIMPKQINYMINYSKVTNIITELDALWEKCIIINELQNEYKELQIKIKKRTYYTYCLYCSAVLTTTVAALLYSSGKDSKNYVLPLGIWTPFENIHFWKAVLWQEISFFFTVTSISCSLSINYVLAEYMTFLLKVLSHILKTRTYEKNKDPWTFILHSRIIRLVYEYNDLMSGQFFYQFLVNSCEIAARTYTMIEASNSHRLDLWTGVYMVYMVILSGIMPFSICYSGTLISKASDDVHMNSYQNQWYFEKSKKCKELLMLTTMASKPLTLHYRHLVTYGMAQFTTFCQAAYSYIMALRYLNPDI